MIKFNPDKKEVLTFDEALGPAMLVETHAEADAYLTDYIAYLQKQLKERPHPRGLTAPEIARINLSYEVGYCSKEVADRVNRLFKINQTLG